MRRNFEERKQEERKQEEEERERNAPKERGRGVLPC
jgi:hypothetical protein